MTTEQPLFYRQPVALDRNLHARRRVDTGIGHGFARATHAVGIAAVEFEHAAREYPIIFASEDGVVYPVAVLGLKRDENLFVDAKGRWDAEYLPAYVRRYPFILAAQQEADQFTVVIDEAFEGWNEERGERLFLDDGAQSPYLERIVAFLRDFQAQHERTREFAEHLKSLELLEPMQADISWNDGEHMQLSGFLVVSRDRLNALEADRLVALVQTGQMEAIYQHLFSLGNFKRLMERFQRRSPPASE